MAGLWLVYTLGMRGQDSTMTIELPRSVEAWRTDAFETVFKAEAGARGVVGLGLQQALTTGSLALDEGIEVVVLSRSEAGGLLRVKAGIFFRSIIAGCGCADDPTPIDENTEYCERWFLIDPRTGRASLGDVD